MSEASQRRRLTVAKSWLLMGAMTIALGAAAPAFAYGGGSGGGGAGGGGGVAAIQAKLSLATRDVDALKHAQEAIDFKEWDKAILILSDLTTRFDRSADLENLLGFSYRMHGEFQQAFNHYDKALALDPKHKGALEYEGEAFLETDQLPKAETNLSTLKTACGGQACQEYALLKGAIDRYKAKARIN
jgi:tetratricopeptide (TPR) repeat protein